MSVTQTTIKRLPSIVKEDVGILKIRIQELEKEVISYKGRLDELRKAKNNLVIKKTTEYVKLGNPTGNQGNQRDKEPLDEQRSQEQSDQNNLYYQELERTIERLNNQLTDANNIIEGMHSELDDSKNLVAALRLENEDAKGLIEKMKHHHQAELADAYAKNEESSKEVRKWESMFKEWMQTMEDRVNNINRTHSVLQRCLNDSNPDNDKVN